MRATHEIVGVDWGIRSSQIRMEAYNKQYAAIPASTEYPTVSFHTQVEQIGEQFVWLPMNSDGRGNASGIELSDITRIRSRVQVQGSIAYARAKFAGTDGILRPSNYDFPWIANLAGVGHLGRGYNVSARYGYETGRPYTPFDLSKSLAQNRPIYDLTKVNALRAPYYSRLDAQINKEIAIGSSHLELYGGVDNILNRRNLLSYAWMPRAGDRSAKSIGTLWQTPIFPNFGVRVVVH
jgi:hypothetical protein